jgi:uncharacterized protein (TIGR02391 family)
MRLWDYRPAEILALPIDALALLVLEDFGNGWNVHNYFTERAQHHAATYNAPGVRDRLADAWAWLEGHGLISFNPAQSQSAHARRMTREGAEALEHGLGRLRAAQRIDLGLHPSLLASVPTQFLLGQFELAAFAAMRQVEIRVRELGNYSESQIGVALMTAAFNPKGPGPLVDVEADPGEQEATMALFRGAIGTFKNPSSHRAVNYDDPILASEVVMLADLLLRLLDRVAVNRQTS